MNEKNEATREGEEKMKRCGDSGQRTGLSHDDDTTGDQPSLATSSAAAGGSSAGSGTSGAAGGAVPWRLGGEGTRDGGFDELSLLRRLVAGTSYSRPPRLPRDPKKQFAWLRHLRLFLANVGLEDTLTLSAVTGPVCVISSSRSVLLSQHPESVVAEHVQAWSFISTSVAGSILDEKLQCCESVAEAWSMLEKWVLPLSRGEKYILEQQFHHIPHVPGADPKIYFAEFDRLINIMSAVGIHKTPQQIVDAMIRQLPDEYYIQQAILRAKQDITRHQVEDTIGDAYAERIAEHVTQPPAVPSAPHALFVGGSGGGDRRHSGGGRRRGRGHTTHRKFGYGWQGGTGQPHWQTGLDRRRRRRRRRRRQRYRFEGHGSYCGHWGHVERDCIPARSFSNGFEQPHVDVVTPGYPFHGFRDGVNVNWKDPWGDDIPWQGQQEEETPQSSVWMTAYGGAYAPVPPQSGAWALADSTAYCTADTPQPSLPAAAAAAAAAAGFR